MTEHTEDIKDKPSFFEMVQAGASDPIEITGEDKKKIEELTERNRYLENIRKASFNILEDIAESEEHLRKQTVELEKFRQAVEKSFDHTVITDAEGTILYANHAAEVMTGYSVAEMIGKRPSLWGKQMSQEFYETLWHTIKTEKQGYAGELTNRRKDGALFLTSIRIAPILDEQGEIRFFVGIGRDITDERQAQLKIVRHASELETANARIEEQKERAESILHFLKSIGEGVFATDVEGKIIFMNETAELLSGKAFRDVEQRSVQEVFCFIQENETAAACKTHSPVLHALKTKTRQPFPSQTFLSVGEKKVPISGMCSPIRDESDTVIGVITVFQDVTKKHELEQMKNSFLSVAAHQLRTPLGSMRWSMEMLLNGDLGRLPKAAKEAVTQIYENSQRMITLVNDLLDVARIDQGKTSEEKSPVNIASILEEAVKTMRPAAEKEMIKMTLAIPDEPLPPIMAPPKHLYEAFENLLSNAIKYNKRDGTVTVILEKKDNALRLTIADTGIGIPKEDQSKIFAKFFRAGNAVRKETDGSGLGLSVVKSFLEESQASVWFESEENVGTKFFVEFPLSS